MPAVRGGAVETLIDHYLNYNATHQCHDITVHSIPQQLTFAYKLKRKLFSLTHYGGYYDSHIEYFFATTLADIRCREYDVIIVENRPGYVPRLSKATATPIVLHLHNDILNSDVRDGEAILDACSKVVTVSNYISQRVATIYPTEKIVTIPNGIALTPFTTAVANSSLFTLHSSLKIVFLGRLVPEKGLLEALQALATLNDLDLSITIIGNSIYGDTAEETDYVRELRTAARRLRCPVTFTGYIPSEEIPPLLAAADVALLPSLWEEPAGLTVIECMAAGLAVITTRAGGIPEYADDASVILLDRKDITAGIASAVRRLYGNPALRTKFGAAARHKASTFSAERYAESFLHEIEQIKQT